MFAFLSIPTDRSTIASVKQHYWRKTHATLWYLKSSKAALVRCACCVDRLRPLIWYKERPICWSGKLAEQKNGLYKYSSSLLLYIVFSIDRSTNPVQAEDGQKFGAQKTTLLARRKLSADRQSKHNYAKQSISEHFRAYGNKVKCTQKFLRWAGKHEKNFHFMVCYVATKEVG